MEAEIRDYEAQNKTGNSVLDTLLTSKSLLCKKRGFPCQTFLWSLKKNKTGYSLSVFVISTVLVHLQVAKFTFPI
ncbi:MAG: hypothetical protein LUF92_01180 [Clostridiales bacterium]|nr:hypothetical protein [Clostridiales bacterium]